MYSPDLTAPIKSGISRGKNIMEKITSFKLKVKLIAESITPSEIKPMFTSIMMRKNRKGVWPKDTLNKMVQRGNTIASISKISAIAENILPI